MIKITKYLLRIFGFVLILYSLMFQGNKLFLKKNYVTWGSIGILTEQENSSMKPVIKGSDVILVICSSDRQLEKEDIIAYEREDRIYIQRISNIQRDNGTIFYITKGDNNFNANIEKVTEEQIIGKLWLTIPILGWIAKILQNSYICLFLVLFLFHILFHYRKVQGRHSNVSKNSRGKIREKYSKTEKNML